MNMKDAQVILNRVEFDTHGTKRKTCKREGCTNQVKIGRVCVRHGTKAKVNSCDHERCTAILLSTMEFAKGMVQR